LRATHKIPSNQHRPRDCYGLVTAVTQRVYQTRRCVKMTVFLAGVPFRDDRLDR
jgi:hypothetical protein